jgi:hypothetical protein
MIVAEQVQLNLYEKLTQHISSYFYHPDLEALRVVFSAVHAHRSKADPVWLFVIGPSGSGKTTININCISHLPDVLVASDLTPRSFLVGKANASDRSILNKPSLILAFKDFTTMISKREEDQREIMAALREIYDGKFSRRTAEATVSWEGKATVIAAVTPAIERCWSINRDLGERFSQVRWASSTNPAESARMARAQRGQEKIIATRMHEFTCDFFNSSYQDSAELPDEYGSRIDAAATLAAKLRCHVVRDTAAKREIIDVSLPEEPTRIAKSLATLVCHHAALFGRETVTADDLKIAFRVALDTVPFSRLRIIRNVPADVPIDADDLRKLTDMPKSSISWQTDELEALNILSAGHSKFGGDTFQLTPEFTALWRAAFS